MRTLRMIGDFDVLVAAGHRRSSHLLEGVAAVRSRCVRVQNSPEIALVHKVRQLPRFGEFDLSTALAQLRRNEGQSERGIDLQLGCGNPAVARDQAVGSKDRPSGRRSRVHLLQMGVHPRRDQEGNSQPLWIRDKADYVPKSHDLGSAVGGGYEHEIANELAPAAEIPRWLYRDDVGHQSAKLCLGCVEQVGGPMQVDASMRRSKSLDDFSF